MHKMKQFDWIYTKGTLIDFECKIRINPFLSLSLSNF